MMKKPNKIRDFKNSEFVKTIGITLDDYNFINLNRYKKSRAGMLKKIISHYRKYLIIAK